MIKRGIFQPAPLLLFKYYLLLRPPPEELPVVLGHPPAFPWPRPPDEPLDPPEEPLDPPWDPPEPLPMLMSFTT
jgi:hypothetical protein